MKKLVYLLVLSLCLSGMTGVSFTRMSALAEKDSQAVSNQLQSNWASGKMTPKSSDSKAKKSKSDNGKNKLSKTKVEKEKEYILDLDQNSQVHLSTILKFAKLEIKLKDIKSIEYEDKKYKKYISWEPDEEKEYDYIFTVLKNFKEIRLRIVTKKDEKLLVLQNGAKAGKGKAEKRDSGDASEQRTEDKAAPQPEPEQPAQAEQSAEPEQPAQEAQTDNGKAEEDSVDEATLSLEAPVEVESQAVSEEAEKTTESDTDNAGEEQTIVEIEPDAPEAQAAPETSATEESSQPVEAFSADNADGETLSGLDQDGPVVIVEEETATASAAEEVPVEVDEGQAASTDDQPEVADGKGETGETPAATRETQKTTTEDATEQGSGAPAGEGIESPRNEAGTQIPMEAEAWFKRGIDLKWGTLQEIVGLLTGGETVYIQTGNLLMIREAPLQLLSTVVMTPDTDVFKGGNYRVCISTDNPAIVGEPVLIQPIQMPTMGEKADLYVWVRQEEPTTPGSGDQEEEEKPAIIVTATGLAETGWSQTQPQFTLSGIPEGKEWSYAVIIYDERIVPITSNSYTPDQEGVYTLRFAMLDELGDIVSASERYSLQLDWTPPEVSIEADEETSYTLNISATDNVSGVDKISIDGGKTWNAMEDGSYTITEKEEKTFDAGTIQVTDVAGNLFKTSEEYTTEEAEGGEDEGGEEGEDAGGGGGGGGGGDSSNTPKLPHSSGDGDEGIEYDALNLDIPDEPMEQLTVGGERLELTLLLASAQKPDAPVGQNQPFTAWLRHWDDASEGDALNTLVLEAELDNNIGDVFSYEWHFNGEVYRMLANSGIKYVALKVSDAVVAFPTEGFVGGTRYTELKMQGVSTRKFDYTFTMRLNLDPSHVSAMNESDFSQDCDLSIHVEVEGKNYELSNSPQSMMYFYNVFVGPEDMMDQPFGEYDPAA